MTWITTRLLCFPIGGSASHYDAPVIWFVDHGGVPSTGSCETSISAKVAARMIQDREQEMDAATYLDGGAGPGGRDDLVGGVRRLLAVELTGVRDELTQMTDGAESFRPSPEA